MRKKALKRRYGRARDIRFSLAGPGELRQSDKEFRDNVKKLRRDLDSTRWHPKFNVGDEVRTPNGERVTIGKSETNAGGRTGGYYVTIIESRYFPTGQRVFVHETGMRLLKAGPGGAP